MPKENTSKQFFEEALEKEKRFYHIMEKNRQKGPIKRAILIYSKLLKLDLKLQFTNKGLEIPELDLRITSPYQRQSIESTRPNHI